MLKRNIVALKLMTHKILSGTIISAFAAVLFTAGIGYSYGDSENSAQVIIEFGECIVIDENFDEIIADQGHWVQNKNNGKVTCKAFGVPNPSGEDLRIEGGCFMIGKFGIFSGTFFNQISDNGDGTADIVLQCLTRAP